MPQWQQTQGCRFIARKQTSMHVFSASHLNTETRSFVLTPLFFLSPLAAIMLPFSLSLDIFFKFFQQIYLIHWNSLILHKYFTACLVRFIPQHSDTLQCVTGGQYKSTCLTYITTPAPMAQWLGHRLMDW